MSSEQDQTSLRTPPVWPGFLLVSGMFASDLLGPNMPQPIRFDLAAVLGFLSFCYFYCHLFLLHKELANQSGSTYPLAGATIIGTTFAPRLLAWILCTAWGLYALLIPLNWIVPATIISTSAFIICFLLAVYGDMRWSYDLAYFINNHRPAKIPCWLPGVIINLAFIFVSFYARISFLVLFIAIAILNSFLRSANLNAAPERIENIREPFLRRTFAIKEKYEPLAFRIVIPVASATILSAIASGVWLAAKSQWDAVLKGLLYMFVLPWALYIVLAPLFLIDFINKRLPIARVFEFPLDFVTLVYAYFWGAYYCTGVISTLPSAAVSDCSIPATIWAYAVATLPCIGVAHRQQDDFGSMVALLIIQLTCLALLIVAAPLNLNIYQIFIWMAIPLLVSAFFQTLQRWKESQTNRQDASQSIAFQAANNR
jgi:hypothetical protein